MGMSPGLRNALLSLALVPMGFLLAELLLQIAAQAVPTVNAWTTLNGQSITDPVLFTRPNPDYPDHDARGFRNPVVPATMDIVAIGDSQTYGSGVRSSQSWPRVLERLLRRPVYNMSLGGYGPAHYLGLLAELLPERPRLVLVGFYTGNDLLDTPFLLKRSPNLRRLLSRWRGDGTVAEDAPPTEDAPPDDQAGFPRQDQLPDTSPHWRSLALWINFKVTFLRSLDILMDQEWEQASARAARQGQQEEIFSRAPWRTVFRSAFRLEALDMARAEVAEGFRLTMECFVAMHDLARQQGVSLRVVMIPTKELVFQAVVDPLRVSADYGRLVTQETRVRELTVSTLDRHGVPHLDALPWLRQSLAQGVQPYRVSEDGHPNAAGQEAIARGLEQALLM